MNTAIRRFEPFRELTSLQQDMDRLFRMVGGPRGDDDVVGAGAWTPALDIEESDDDYTVHVELPGIPAEDVEISLEDNVLTVSGERRFYDEKTSEGFHRVERRFGRFHRAVRLPDRLDPEGVTAEASDGIVTVTVPKLPEAKPRRIEITPKSS